GPTCTKGPSNSVKSKHSSASGGLLVEPLSHEQAADGQVAWKRGRISVTQIRNAAFMYVHTSAGWIWIPASGEPKWKMTPGSGGEPPVASSARSAFSKSASDIKSPGASVI